MSDISPTLTVVDVDEETFVVNAKFTDETGFFSFQQLGSPLHLQVHCEQQNIRLLIPEKYHEVFGV